MNKIVLRFIVISIIFFTFTSIVIGQTTGMKIAEYSSDVVINKEGTIDVSENILYDFDTNLKHGIFRTIPIIKTNIDGKKYRLNFTNFSVTDSNGDRIPFKKITDGTEIKLQIGDANSLVSGENTYVISYTVSGALTYYSDHDELYWNVTGNSWDVQLENIRTNISIPENISRDLVNIKCFTGAVGSKSENCNSSYQNGIVTVTADYLNTKEGLSVVIGIPKGMVAVLEPAVYVDFWETILGKIVIVMLIILAFLWYIVLPLSIPIIWYLYGRDPKANMKAVSAWFDPPKDKAGRILTPAETGALVDERVDLRDIAAMIVDLARRGYMKITEVKKDEFHLLKQKETDSKMTVWEKQFFTDLFADGKTDLSLKNTSLYDAFEEVKNSLYKQLMALGFFPKNPDTIRKIMIGVGVVAIFTGNIILGILIFIFGRIMPKKTLLGVETANVASSLKNFLSSQERQLEFQAKNQMFFEKLLPYAVAFGVEKIWAKRFAEIKLVQPDWYESRFNTNFTTVYFVSRLSSSLNQFNHAATPTRSSSGFSSGFSSGGGFSGGGGGGGGGGSW